ncbi:N-acetyltransferase family protein [Psychrobacillus sp. FSL H8-0483]|uniref:GNAT family N-acetyltransferase n=1 Tax=Psychrobacillus sp. FSL H8-0483 TaxID=2921389 RepID=UPI003159F495
MDQDLKFDEMTASDWQQVQAIFTEGIHTGNATFQTKAPTWEEWDMSHSKECRLVARLNGEVAGWIALSPISSREAFSGVSEVSVYVTHSVTGMRIGSKLLKELVTASEKHGFWTLQSMIFPENEGSIKLHRKFGFEEIGTPKRMGKLNGVWRDVVLLERRSNVVGID